MNLAELQAILARSEDTRHQFKADVTNADSVGAELAAFANSGGGQLFIGVNDDGSISGLDAAAVRRINQLVANAATHNVRPPINPATDNVQTDQGLVIVLTVDDGLNKPYADNQARIWVKSGSDKRHVTAREEIQRMFQQAGLVQADVVPVVETSEADIEPKAFSDYFNRRYGPGSGFDGESLMHTFQNLGLAHNGALNLSGLLLFGKNPQRYRPSFDVKAVAFPGTDMRDTRYLDSEDITGTLLEQYQRSLSFIKRNLRHVQGDQGFNTQGQLEIPEQAIEELLVNALIHRDYFTQASVRIMVFSDRVEIISPGHLPDALTAAAVRRGTSLRRNPTLTAHAINILPYRGLGTGIPRAIQNWPETELFDDREANQFKVILLRPAAVTGEVTPEVTPEVTGEVRKLLAVMKGKMKRAEIQQALELKDEKHFREAYLQPALKAKVIEMTQPDKPKSSTQRYRLTAAGTQIIRSDQQGS